MLAQDSKKKTRFVAASIKTPCHPSFRTEIEKNPDFECNVNSHIQGLSLLDHKWGENKGGVIM